MTNQETRNEERGVPGWLEFYDLSWHRDVESREPLGAYIRGMLYSSDRLVQSSKYIPKKMEAKL